MSPGPETAEGEAAKPLPAPGLAAALARHQAGDLVAAEHGYRDILRASPEDPWAAHLLSLILLQKVGAVLPEALSLLARVAASPDADAAMLKSLNGAVTESLPLGTLLETCAAVAEGEARALNDAVPLMRQVGQLKSGLRDVLDRTPAVSSATNAAFYEVTAFTHEFLSLQFDSADQVFCGDKMSTLQKSCGFRDDARFMAAFKRNAHATGEEPGRAWRLHTLIWAARNALHLAGDFVECGVYRGFMSATVCDYLDFAKVPKTFYLYDTFAGFAPAYSSPDDFGIHAGFFNLAQNEYSQPDIYESVRQRFRSYPNVRIVRGVVPESFVEAVPDRIAYCHIDLNSPAAEVGALEVLFDRVVPGGMVVFDDYGWLPFAKQKAAEDAFAERRGYNILELPTGQGLLVKR